MLDSSPLPTIQISPPTLEQYQAMSDAVLHSFLDDDDEDEYRPKYLAPPALLPPDRSTQRDYHQVPSLPAALPPQAAASEKIDKSAHKSYDLRRAIAQKAHRSKQGRNPL